MGGLRAPRLKQREMVEFHFRRSLTLSSPDRRPGPLRWLSGLAEIPYALAVRRRNARFDRCGPRLRMPIPVVSVGNITVGGTGKTPVVIKLVQMLLEMGRRPAVIARGYRAAPGQPNDEERIIQRACPGTIYVADPDRCAGAAVAHEVHGADVLVLDDGFQHRALARDLDLVLIDALCPFGFDHLLPRGLLREPVGSLARAGAVLLTRSDQVDAESLAQIAERIRPVLAGKPLLQCRHRLTSLETLEGEPMPLAVAKAMKGEHVALFAGIGRPEAFERTVRDLGVEDVGHRWFPDHHRFSPLDIERIEQEFPGVDWLLTTEKDAVKLSSGAFRHAKVAVVKVAIDMSDADAKMLRSLVGKAVARYPG